MTITDDALPWFTEDEQNWNAFLQTTTGQRLMPKLAQLAPVLLARGHVNAILIRSGEVRGVQSILQAMLDLTHSPPQPKGQSISPNYPDPEDDTQWSDGEKLNPKEK